MDTSGNLRLQSLPDISDGNVVTIISSPGTPSLLLSLPQQPKDKKKTLDTDDLSLLVESTTPTSTTTSSANQSVTLLCQGATLQKDDGAMIALATSSLVAGSIVLEGISLGDLEAGLVDSRHGKTLSAIFRARLAASPTATTHDDDNDVDDHDISLPERQTLVVPIADAGKKRPLVILQRQVEKEIATLFAAVALETETKLHWQQLYDLKIVTFDTPEEVRLMAIEQATSCGTKGSLSVLLTKAHKQAKASIAGSSLNRMDHSSAQAMVVVGKVYSRHSHTVRAKVAAWKARVARGLVSEGFGNEAQVLYHTLLHQFDSETIGATAFPAVAAYRKDLRGKLQSLLETGIQEVFDGQMENLEKNSLARLNQEFLQTFHDPVEKKMDSDAAALRNVLHAFEKAALDLEVPFLGLTQEKEYRRMETKLMDAMDRFGQSPAARIQRFQKQKKKVVPQKSSPQQRSIDVGLDLVAVLRPDGFGSLQGFLGYQLGGHSITFGVTNDADDPQIIAQFGGVRPPLLRVQPKLRLDVQL